MNTVGHIEFKLDTILPFTGASHPIFVTKTVLRKCTAQKFCTRTKQKLKCRRQPWR